MGNESVWARLARGSALIYMTVLATLLSVAAIVNMYFFIPAIPDRESIYLNAEIAAAKKIIKASKEGKQSDANIRRIYEKHKTSIAAIKMLKDAPERASERK